MVCGVHLGILLICLVAAEHVHCLWATQAQSYQGHNSDSYVGFSQQESGLRRLSSRNPQNQLRQASVSSGSAQTNSLNAQTPVRGVYTQKLSSSSFSLPAQSGSSSVRFAQSNSVSEPNRQVNSKKTHEPKKFFGLSTDIASGSSVSKYNKKQNEVTDNGRATWPVQQEPQRESKYPSRSSASSSSSKLSPQRAPSTAVQGGYLAQESSSFFSPQAPSSQRHSVRVKTSASAPARRVHIRRTKVPRPVSNVAFESQTGVRGNAQGSYRAPSSMQYAPSSLQPRGLQSPTNQRFSYNSDQSTSSTSSWNDRNLVQGTSNPPARSGTGPRYAPTKVYDIPQRFGGFAIRRLGDSKKQKEVSVRKPQQTYAAPSAQIVSYKPQAHAIGKPKQTYTPQVQSISKQEQAYSALSAQVQSYRPQVQSISKPQETYSAPSAQVVSYRPQVQNVGKLEQTNRTPSAQLVAKPPVQSSSIQKQTYSASSGNSMFFKPQAQSSKSQHTYSVPSFQVASQKPQIESSIKPKDTHAAPSAQMSYSPPAQSIRKPHQTVTAPSALIESDGRQIQSVREPQQAQSVKIVSYKPQQSFAMPSAQSVFHKPQVQSLAKPQQTYTAPSGQTVSQNPQVQNVGKPERAQSQGPSAEILSHNPQQSSAAPSGQRVSHRQHSPSQWMRIQPQTGRLLVQQTSMDKKLV